MSTVHAALANEAPVHSVAYRCKARFWLTYLQGLADVRVFLLSPEKLSAPCPGKVKNNHQYKIVRVDVLMIPHMDCFLASFLQAIQVSQSSTVSVANVSPGRFVFHQMC